MAFRQANAPQFFYGLFDGPQLLGFVNGTCCAGEELHHATMSECVCVKCQWIDVDGSRGYMPGDPRRRRSLRLTHTRRFDYTQNTGTTRRAPRFASTPSLSRPSGGSRGSPPVCVRILFIDSQKRLNRSDM